MEKYCKCGILLILGENWLESNQRANNYICRDCSKKKRKINYMKNKERELEKQAEYRRDNAGKERKRKKKYREENKESLLKKEAEFRKNNPEYIIEYREKNKDRINKQRTEFRKKNRERLKIKQREFYNENKDYYKALAIERKRKLKKASLNRFDLENIVEFYKNCEKCKQVDHIIPINGKNVSGLHVTWNMQYLTPDENNFKSNKFDRTYENEDWKTEKE